MLTSEENLKLLKEKEMNKKEEEKAQRCELQQSKKREAEERHGIVKNGRRRFSTK